MPGLQLGGLASGLDTQTVIAQLMAVERRPKQLAEFRRDAVQARQEALQDISGKLGKLKLAATDLRSVTLWSPTQTVESSDPAKVAVRRTGGAGTGGYTVAVQNLASSSQRTFTYTPQGADSQMTFGAKTFAILANATLDDVVNQINSAADSPVVAVNAGGKLVASSKTTGAASVFAWTSAALAQDAQRDGVDANYTVDGVAKPPSATNVVANGIPGIELTLKGATAGATVTVGAPGPDKKAITDKLKAFVETYNALNDTIRTKTAEKRVNSATNSTDAKKGALFADRGLSDTLSRLRIAVQDPVAGNPPELDSLAQLGITAGALGAAGSFNKDAVSGRLVLDEAKLAAALDANPLGVQRLLGGVTGVSGFAQRLEGVIDPLTQAGGEYPGRIESASGDLTRLKDSIDRWDRRLTVKEESLRAKFTQMERLLSANQSRQVDLSRLGYKSE